MHQAAHQSHEMRMLLSRGGGASEDQQSMRSTAVEMQAQRGNGVVRCPDGVQGWALYSTFQIE